MDASVDYSLAFYADVARRAAAETKGVIGTARDPFLGLVGRIAGGYNRGGVKVYRDSGEVCMEVDIVAAYGSNLRQVLNRAQRQIVKRVKDMSGEAPARVTVAVKGVAGKEQQ